MQGSLAEEIPYQNVKEKLELLEREFNIINDDITTNLKVYD